MEVKVVENVLRANEAIARENAGLFREKDVYVINLMAAPGAGKTSLIEQTLGVLGEKFRVAVIEGDIASKVDAEKIKKHGVEAVQINTGGACHLDANMVKSALPHINLDETDLLIIENVGNLVCPADFKLGENVKVMVSSVAEGDDKPLKYPAMFNCSSALVLNKTDLLSNLPEASFDLDKFKVSALKTNPKIEIFEVSCLNGDGIKNWAFWAEKVLVQNKEATVD